MSLPLRPGKGGLLLSVRVTPKCSRDEVGGLHVASDGTVQTCRVHKEPLGHVSEGLARIWDLSKKRREEIVRDCEGCLFFGYVENSLLYDFRPEVLAHYQWM